VIPFNKPVFGISEFKSFLKGFFNDNITSRFEEDFSRYIKRKFALFTSSGRSALYLTYKSLKLDGEIIVAPLTCSIAIMPLICAGLKPYFVDIDSETFNIDPEKINEAITKKTVGIQVIHIGGNPCDMRPIQELAKDHSLYLIEDCAQSLGAEYQREQVGCFGDFSCFSLSKSLYGISGGMIVSDDQNIISKAAYLQSKFDNVSIPYIFYRFFRNSLEAYRNNVIINSFYKGLMLSREINPKVRSMLSKEEDCWSLQETMHRPSKVEATMSFSQFKSINNLLARKIENALFLSSKLKKIPEIKIQRRTKDSKHVYTRYIISTPYESKKTIQKSNNMGIEAKHLAQKYGSFFQERFDRHPLFSKYDSIKNCKNYLEIHDRILSLPMSPNMTTNEILYIANCLQTIIDLKRIE
jgi:dTDP-4-amino-4,6-dideoxygalactose transaminase